MGIITRVKWFCRILLPFYENIRSLPLKCGYYEKKILINNFTDYNFSF